VALSQRGWTGQTRGLWVVTCFGFLDNFSSYFTRGLHRWTDFNSMTCFHTRRYFLGSQWHDDTAPPRLGSNPLNWHFQVKHEKYANLHIIKTTVSITTKFCKIIIDKLHQILFVDGPNMRTTNPIWRTSATWKSKNRHIWAVVQQICSKFHLVTHIVPMNCTMNGFVFFLL